MIHVINPDCSGSHVLPGEIEPYQATIKALLEAAKRMRMTLEGIRDEHTDMPNLRGYIKECLAKVEHAIAQAEGSDK